MSCFFFLECPPFTPPKFKRDRPCDPEVGPWPMATKELGDADGNDYAIALRMLGAPAGVEHIYRFSASPGRTVEMCLGRIGGGWFYWVRARVIPTNH